jgi:hypothetical protein
MQPRRVLQISTCRAQNRSLIPSCGLGAQQSFSRRQAFPAFCGTGDCWALVARLDYPADLRLPIVRQLLALQTTNQLLMLYDGGTGLLDGRNAASPDREFCTEGSFSRLRYIQRNIIAPNVLTNTQLVTPTPRNTLMVHVSRGKQIAVLEEETHKECRGRPIRPR